MNTENFQRLISKYDGDLEALVSDVIFNTICMCSSMCSDSMNSPIRFIENKAYEKFIDDTISHIVEGEVYSPYINAWYVPETIDTTS